MPYIKQNWVNDVTPLDATHMNYIENGIETVSNEVVEANASIEEIHGVVETMQIAVADWNADSTIAPYTASAHKNMLAPLADVVSVELVNNNPVLFAKYGLAISDVVGQTIYFYAMTAPSEDVILRILLKKVL